jgi:hypothetical protein
MQWIRSILLRSHFFFGLLLRCALCAAVASFNGILRKQNGLCPTSSHNNYVDSAFPCRMSDTVILFFSTTGALDYTCCLKVFGILNIHDGPSQNWEMTASVDTHNISDFHLRDLQGEIELSYYLHVWNKCASRHGFALLTSIGFLE